MISNKSIRYFDTIDGERLIFSDQSITDSELMKEDITISKKILSKNIPKMLYNFSRDNRIAHMHPNSDKCFKQEANTLISQFNNLEKLFI